MYTYKVGISAKEHDDFVLSSQQINLLQSSNWAKIKDNWQNERIGFYKDQHQVASASLLIKKLPLGFTMIYIPRGPVMDYSNQELVDFVVKSLKRYAKTKRTLFITFDPALLFKSYTIGEETVDQESSLKAVENLKNSGVIWSGKTTLISESIQPRFQANVYTQQSISTSFPKKIKYLLKQAQTKGVTIKRYSENAIDMFSEVIAMTEKRQGIQLRSPQYFKKMMATYDDNAYLYLATIDLSKKLTTYQDKLNKLNQEISETTEQQKKRLTKLNEQKKSTEKFITELSELNKYYTGTITVSGALALRYGQTMDVLYAGMNEDFKRFSPQYLLYSTLFEEAYQEGVTSVNLGGVEGNLQDGLTKFKSHFNPKIEEFIGEFNIPTHPFYHLAQLAYTLRKKLRHKH